MCINLRKELKEAHWFYAQPMVPINIINEYFVNKNEFYEIGEKNIYQIEKKIRINVLQIRKFKKKTFLKKKLKCKLFEAIFFGEELIYFIHHWQNLVHTPLNLFQIVREIMYDLKLVTVFGVFMLFVDEILHEHINDKIQLGIFFGKYYYSC